ncbi:FKBP-type peptidyl-prolyl cis-trans isomerase [Hymenobacter sp. B1770]|uniref:FKBP-type peptidyl-prolyl cis-trans isomerase n=1 Tax=Hymenobacter sp. B1770 TaxID=1718788 RepID=UPI003CF4462D
MMRYPLFSAVCALFVLLQSAHAQTPALGFSRLPSGTEYRLFRKDAAGRYQPRTLAPTDAPYATRAGQILTVFLEFRTGRDSVLMKSRQMQPIPQPVPLPAQPVPGGMEEALGLLLPGDSASFRFPADSLFAKTFRQPVPLFIRKSGNTMVVLASAQELFPMSEMPARAEKIKAQLSEQVQRQAVAQTAQDAAQIEAYIKKNKLVAKKTAGGTYYIVTRPGKGPLPQKGQTVRVLYRGTVLATGKEFDSSAKHGNEPIAFALGAGRVIAGWDQGIAMLTAGSKAVLLIPSSLAYGSRGAGADIPANAVLRFEVELVDFK